MSVENLSSEFQAISDTQPWCTANKDGFMLDFLCSPDAEELHYDIHVTKTKMLISYLFYCAFDFANVINRFSHVADQKLDVIFFINI